jgi:hypothetical protein
MSERLYPSMPWMPAAVGFLAGSLFIYLLDKYMPHLHINFSDNETEGMKTQWRRTTLLILAITLHNIPEGLAVGVLFGAAANGMPEASIAGAVALAFGIGIQNFPEGLAVAVPLRRQGVSRLKSFWYGQLSAIVEPIAGVIGALAVIWGWAGYSGWIKNGAAVGANGEVDVAEAAYRTVAALGPEGSYLSPDNTELQIARFAGIALPLAGLLLAFSAQLGRSIAQLLNKWAADHVVIAGSGPAAVALADDCVKRGDGRDDLGVVTLLLRRTLDLRGLSCCRLLNNRGLTLLAVLRRRVEVVHRAHG